jgi:hypothetical protein
MSCKRVHIARFVYDLTQPNDVKIHALKYTGYDTNSSRFSQFLSLRSTIFVHPLPACSAKGGLLL